MSRYDIAIIGMGCVFPKANDIEQYWKNVVSGEPFFQDMPDRLWRQDNFYSPDKSRSEKSYTKVGAFIEGFEFPFLEYKLPPNTMKGVDMGQLVTIDAVGEALADAGIAPRSDELINGITLIGGSGVDQFSHSTLYLRRQKFTNRLIPALKARGVSDQQLAALDEEFKKELFDRGHTYYPAVASFGSITSSLSNRVAQVFGIKGFNMTMDGACASSFVAVDTACHALMSGDADIALAGGTDLGINPAIYVGFSRVDGLSTKGMANPFDHTADGLIIGEGAGVCVLKRLEDAIRDGNRIRAVIRGVGSSSDGAGQAIYNPSLKGRVLALENALDQAEIDPNKLQFVEAHATSTIVGDANEYDMISLAYGKGRNPDNLLRIGSVKGQIGHLKAAAGMAGLIKTVLAMDNETLPHMPRFTKLTPGAEHPHPAIIVPTELAKWETRSDGKRYAGVTSSGFGGVNYHVILEHGDSYDPPKERPKVPNEVAVVGMTCRVAGADTVDGFWDNVKKGKDTFTRLKGHGEEVGWEDHLDAGPKEERITTRVVSKLAPYDQNLLRHKIFPTAVNQISPTQFLGLDLSDRLLTDAGFELAPNKNIGVSIGAMHDDYFPSIFGPMLVDEYADSIRQCPTSKKIDQEVLEACLQKAGDGIKEDNPPVTEHTLPGWMTNVVAGRIANKLNLNGPNFTVDAACSSGVGALLPAIYELMYGKVDLMISGGLNQQLSDAFTVGVCALGACAEEVPRPYDAEGKGYLIGEGGVFYLLKRLEDAKRDGDDILAIIHSVDGSSEADTKSMIAPTEEAVRRSIRRALAKTDIKPVDIGVVDTHGSANLLSDVVEVNALGQELRKEDGDSPVEITAIKSHVGHLYGGSGAASLFSTIQSLRTRQIPGIRNLENPRPEIEAMKNRARPRMGTVPLSEKAKAGGVNSLGLGGANYFVVVSVPEDRQGKADTPDPETAKQLPKRTATIATNNASVPFMREEDTVSSDIFVCVAESQDGLQSALGRALQQAPIPQFISEGNVPSSRLAATYESDEELKTKLANTLRMFEGGHSVAPLESQGVFVAEVVPGGAQEKLVFCFPGQGTHYIGMGQNLYHTHPEFKAVLDDVDALARKALDFELLAHIHGDKDDPEIAGRLGTLVGAQTALFSMELGMAKVLDTMGIVPDAMIGHSFGEISAMVVAGVWDLETGFKVVEERIKAAELVIKGGGPALGMMSVICSEEQRDAILEIFEGKVVLTNINAPGRFIMAGERSSVERTVKVAESFGADARLLPIGTAFHSHYMEPARIPFRDALRKLPCSKPKYPIMSTVTGQYVDPQKVTPETLAEHLSNQFITKLNLPREVEHLHADGARHFIEVGPGWSMTKMVRAILDKKSFRAVPMLHPKVGDVETFRRARAFLMALGHMDSAAERQNLPGIFSPDFVDYLEASEPAVLALIEEVHKRYLHTMQSRSAQIVAPAALMEPKQAGPAPMAQKAEPVKPAEDASVWIERIKKKLVEATGYPAEMLETDLDLEADLGVDSVQRAEIWITLTEEHGLDKEARPAAVRTIAQLAEALAELAGGNETVVSASKPESAPPALSSAVADNTIWIERIKKKLVEATGYPAEMLETDLDLEADLGVDSVQRAEIWIALTEEHSLNKEARPAAVRTIAQLAEALAELTGGNVAAAPVSTTEQAATAPTSESTPAPVPALSPAAAEAIPLWIERIIQKLVEATGYPAEMLETGLDLEADLGVDSVQRAEIWISLTEEYDLDKEARPAAVRTIAQFAEVLAGLAGQGAEGDLAGSRAEVGALSSDTDKGKRDSDCQLFVSASGPVPADTMSKFECKKALCVVAKLDKWTESVKGRFEKHGVDVQIVEAKTLLGADPKAAGSLVDGCDTLVYLAHKGMADTKATISKLRKMLDTGMAELFGCFRTLAQLLEKNPVRIVVPVTLDGTFGASPLESRGMLAAFPTGFVRSLAHELPDCTFQLIDTGDVSWLDAIEQHIDVISSVPEIGMTKYGLVRPVLAQVAPAATSRLPLGKGDLVLVTGGARGIVFECVAALAKETGCKLLLTGRTVLPEGKPSWLDTAPGEIDGVIRGREIELVRSKRVRLGEAKRIGVKERAQWELVRNIKRLESAGIETRYQVCDVSNDKEFSALVAKVSAKEAIRGVVHGAGVQRSKLIGELQDEAVALTLSTKINPLLTLLETLDWSKVRLLSCFGSITGMFGNAGQTDYALANSLLGWMTKCIGTTYANVTAQTIDWTAWAGTGMVTDEEAKRFQEVGIIPVDVNTGVAMFMTGLAETEHKQLAAFNANAEFVAGRALASYPVAAQPLTSLTTENGRARFSLEKDVYLQQHLVETVPVVPGTFVSEVFNESVSGENLDICDVLFRRPLWIREEDFEVEVERNGDSLLLLPSKRPELTGKAVANLSFATCKVAKSKPGTGAKLEFSKADLKALGMAATNGGISFYKMLDEKFSHALKTGPVFRGVKSVVERNGDFFGAMTLTDEALSVFELPGKLAFNPVLADMAVQIASAWAMEKKDVMAIPRTIGRLHVAGETRNRDAIVICRAREITSEQITVDLAVRELDGRLIMTMDELVSRTISDLEE
ncbi:MAG: acyltransferase domain-containing protein [Proteobacteria bacterium]|nr:acyltransferase domain-containing protein [Pseudomonadota bacterium]